MKGDVPCHGFGIRVFMMDLNIRNSNSKIIIDRLPFGEIPFQIVGLGNIINGLTVFGKSRDSLVFYGDITSALFKRDTAKRCKLVSISRIRIRKVQIGNPDFQRCRTYLGVYFKIVKRRRVVDTKHNERVIPTVRCCLADRCVITNSKRNGVITIIAGGKVVFVITFRNRINRLSDSGFIFRQGENSPGTKRNRQCVVDPVSGIFGIGSLFNNDLTEIERIAHVGIFSEHRRGDNTGIGAVFRNDFGGCRSVGFPGWGEVCAINLNRDIIGSGGDSHSGLFRRSVIMTVLDPERDVRKHVPGGTLTKFRVVSVGRDSQCCPGINIVCRNNELHIPGNPVNQNRCFIDHPVCFARDNFRISNTAEVLSVR